MNLLDTRPRSPREVWHSETEEVSRADLAALVTVALRNPLRTWPEQQALLLAIRRLTYPPITDMTPLEDEAVENWQRAHRCDCGRVSRGYWCSNACQLEQDGPYTDDEADQ